MDSKQPSKRIEPSNPASDIDEQNARVEYLRFLYIIDGRKSRDHPKHRTYTGLYQKAMLKHTETHRKWVLRACPGMIRD